MPTNLTDDLSTRVTSPESSFVFSFKSFDATSHVLTSSNPVNIFKITVPSPTSNRSFPLLSPITRLLSNCACPFTDAVLDAAIELPWLSAISNTSRLTSLLSSSGMLLTRNSTFDTSFSPELTTFDPPRLNAHLNSPTVLVFTELSTPSISLLHTRLGSVKYFGSYFSTNVIDDTSPALLSSIGTSIFCPSCLSITVPILSVLLGSQLTVTVPLPSLPPSSVAFTTIPFDPCPSFKSATLNPPALSRVNAP